MPARAAHVRRDGQVAIVTDSAACLPAVLVEANRVIVVPLRLVAGGVTALDGDASQAGAIEQAAARGERLTTARPAPEHFAAAYRRAASAGAGAVVSVHLSARMSGTAGSAELAAAAAPVPVTVVDAGAIAMSLGLTVLAAAAVARAGRPADEVAALARWHADLSSSYFAVDSAAALLASGRWPGREQPAGAGAPVALAARPILQITGGRIALLERVRTRAAAAERLAELATAAARSLASGRLSLPEGKGEQGRKGGLGGYKEPAASDGVDLAVQHTAAPQRAAVLRDRLVQAIPAATNVYLVEAGLAIMAHTGRGMLGVAIGPHVPAG